MSKRLASTIAALVVVAAGVLGGVGVAHAAAYRYWTYWQGGTGTWAFATAGPASLIPPDGSVEGWRFAVTTTAGNAIDAPQAAPDFAAICGSTPAQPNHKRVALVVDPGSPAIAPEGQTPPPPITTCVVAEPDATGYQVLRATTSVRTDKGLICAVSDYPSGECAPVVDDPVVSAAPSGPSEPSPSVTASTTAMAPSGDSATPSGAPWITAAVVALLAIVGIVLWRRRA